MTTQQPADGGKHDAGQTSTSTDSGNGGKHSSRTTGYPLGTRTQRPHHPHGWSSDR